MSQSFSAGAHSMAIVIDVCTSTDSNCVHSSSETCSQPTLDIETNKQLKEVVTRKLFFAYWLLALGYRKYV